MQKQSNDEMTFADFKKTILGETTELRKEKNEKVLAIANSLERAASYDGKNEDALTTALLADNTDKFSIAKNAISAEIRETKALSAKFKEFFASGNITGLDRQTNTTIKIAALTPGSDHITQANTLLASYNASAVSAFEELQNPKEDTELQDIGNSLKSRVLALTESASTETFSEKAEREKVEMAGNITTGDVTDSENLASQAKSSYTYRGIYYFENGKQKRLFDYTDELDGTENTVLVNRSSGGAKNSIVYRMDNGLYLKHPVADTPTGTNTDTPDTLALDDIMGDRSTPSAPNYFNETVVSPDEIQFSFASANKDQDRKFRLEFYDYIERFDRLKDGANIETISPKTPLQTIDLFADDDRLVTDATKPGALISKTEAVYERGVGDASGTIAQYKTFSAGETLKVSADRRLYSYNGTARIKYRKDDATEWVVASLKEYENITFSEAMEIQVLDGSVVFAEDRYDAGNVDMGKLAGLPIMEKTSLTLLGDTGFFVVRYDDDSSVRIDRRGTYSLLRIGNPSDSYAVSVKKPNDFYYAKLSSFGNGEDTTEASLTLLSPQVAGDESGPINIGLADVYRIPIYTKEIFAAKIYFSDISGIARMAADTDPNTDSDGNGVTDDDQDSNSNGFIHKNPNDPTELTIGPFDAPGTHAITLSVVDKNGNVTKQNLSIIAYTPTPEILSNSGTHISGKLESEIG